MNPLTKVKLISQLNELEAQDRVTAEASWHSEYKDSSWIFLGGLPYELTEGDILCVFSQYGEIVNINLVRNSKTGKSKGFCFVCYEDQRSTVLAVDNFNGIKIKGRTIRVDHVSNYRPPRVSEDVDNATRKLWEKGCGAQTPSSNSSEGSEDEALSRQHELDKQKRSKNREKTATAVAGKDKEEQPEQQPSMPARGHIKKETEAPDSRKETKAKVGSRKEWKPYSRCSNQDSALQETAFCGDVERGVRKETPTLSTRPRQRQEERRDSEQDQE